MKNAPIFSISLAPRDPVSALPNEQSVLLGLLLLMASPSSSVFFTTTKSFLMKLDTWEIIDSVTTLFFHGKSAVLCIWGFGGDFGGVWVLGFFVRPGSAKDQTPPTFCEINRS